MRAVGGLVRRLPAPVFKTVFSSFLARGHDDRERAAESVASHWHHYAAHEGAAAFARQIRSLQTADTLSVAGCLPVLVVPARVVWGMADRFQKASYGARLARDLGVPLMAIEGARHFLPEDHPAEVAAAIEEVIAAGRW